MDIDIYDTIDNIYKLPLASKEALLSNQAGYENIELLADIHMDNWERKFAERECVKSAQLFISRQFKNSFERYQDLIADSPDILQRVPL
jgi:hypothetical protein